MAHEEMMVQASFNDTLPAVDQNRMVSSPPLHFYYLPNDIVDSPQVIALPSCSFASLFAYQIVSLRAVEITLIVARLSAFDRNLAECGYCISEATKLTVYLLYCSVVKRHPPTNAL